MVKSKKINSDSLVSVIVPVYNTEDYLEECFLSLKEQTYKNIEMIFVNDGSTDGSEELLKKFEKEDKRARVFNKKNEGLSSARNAGLKVARGEFVTFLDSDDYLTKGAIGYLVGLALKHGVGIVACPHYEDYGGIKKDFNRGGFPTKVFSIEEGLREMLEERGFNLQATSKLYKRELFKNIRFPEGKLHEDVGATYKLFLEDYSENNKAKMVFGSEPQYYYRMREGSIVNKFDFRKMDLVELTDMMCDEIDAVFPALNDSTNLRRMHARFSILRQTVLGKQTAKKRELSQEMRKYLLEHREWVMKNPEATKRDKLALKTLRIGNWFFGFSWNFYESFLK